MKKLLKKYIGETFHKTIKRGKIVPYYPYNMNKRNQSYFSHKLTTISPWQFEPYLQAIDKVKDNDIYKIWQNIDGGIKFQHYFDVYTKIFAEYRHQPLKILEIGVLNGNSLKMWRAYFDHPDTQIIGIDINPDCQQYQNKDSNIHVRIGAQGDHKFLSDIVNEFGTFDIIMDDGSHIARDQIDSFNNLFIDGLNDNGIYMIEDTHTAYYTKYRDLPISIQDYAYLCVDYMNYHYGKYPHGDFTGHDNVSDSLSLDVPKISQILDEVRFFDSIIVFYKNTSRKPPMDLRS